MDVFSAILFRNTHLNCCVKHPQYVDAQPRTENSARCRKACATNLQVPINKVRLEPYKNTVVVTTAQNYHKKKLGLSISSRLLMDMLQSANQRGAAKAGQSSQHSASAGAYLARLTSKLNRAAKRSSIYSRQRAFEVNFPTAISCKSDSLAACHNSKAQQSVTVPYLCQLVQHGNKNRQRVC